jgi:integrase
LAGRPTYPGLYQHPGKKTWWLRWTPTPGGPRLRQSLGTTDFTEAIAKAETIRRTDGPQHRAAAAECTAEIDAYITAKRIEGLTRATLDSRRYVLRSFAAATAAQTPRHITPGACAVWFAHHLKAKPQTAIAYLRQVRWWLAWLIEQNKLGTDPTADITPPRIRPQPRRLFLLPDEARAVLDTCTDPSLKFVLYCALHAGMRKLEIIEAVPSWFDLTLSLIHIDSTPTFVPKDRERRTVPLTDEFRTFLIDTYGLPAPFMFRPEQKHGRSVYRADFRKRFNTHLAKLHLSRFTFHDLRRTFASLLVSAGVSIFKVAKWLGDEIETAESTYGHLIPQDDEINAAWHRPTAPTVKAPHHRRTRLPRRRR